MFKFIPSILNEKHVHFTKKKNTNSHNVQYHTRKVHVASQKRVTRPWFLQKYLLIYAHVSSYSNVIIGTGIESDCSFT